MARCHVVHLHGGQIVTAHQGLSWGQFHEKGLKPRQCVRDAKNQTAFALANARPLARFLNQFLQRENFGSAELVSFSGSVAAQNTLSHCMGYVFHPHGLKACLRSRQGHDRGDALKLRKQV